MKNLLNVFIVTSFVVLLVSFWNRNSLPGTIDYVTRIANEPKQSASESAPFDVEWDGTQYRISPEFEYDITGMVVSFRHHDDNSRMHRLAGDHLNMLDVCVVWGDNTAGAQLEKIDFWNGIFTCNVKTRDQAAWESFDMQQLSNNHLLSDDEFLRDRVRDLQVGDQIRIRGYLASYDSPGGRRGTSTTRTDTGDGACETIYVRQFELLARTTNVWRVAMYVAALALVVSLLLYFRRPFRSHLG